MTISVRTRPGAAGARHGAADAPDPSLTVEKPDSHYAGLTTRSGA